MCAVFMASFGLLFASVMGSFGLFLGGFNVPVRSRLIFFASSATLQSSKKLSSSLGTVVAVMVDLGELRLVDGRVQSDHGELEDRPLLSRAWNLGT